MACCNFVELYSTIEGKAYLVNYKSGYSDEQFSKQSIEEAAKVCYL